jgi:ABC-type nitrate/sulfonate/bicarbonate transport system substrate-binding protein
MSTLDIEVNAQNLSNLVGKTIGVMQLANVPGLTLKCALNAQNVPFEVIQDVNDKRQNKVNLMAINMVETARDDIDLFLIPSPQADAKESSTSLKVVGSLSEIYGDFGFPQAIIVAKNSVIDKNFSIVEAVIDSVKNAEIFLKEDNKNEILTLINSKIESGLTPVFNEKNLTNLSIERSKIKFISAKNSKEIVEDFIEKLKLLQPNSVEKFSENFYYLGDL